MRKGVWCIPALAACGGPVVVEQGPCEQLVTCAAAVEDDGGAAAEAQFGPDGSCWSLDDPTQHETCRTECTAGLVAYAEQDLRPVVCPHYDWESDDGRYEGPVRMQRGEDCANPLSLNADATLVIERTAPGTLRIRNTTLLGSRITWVGRGAWPGADCALELDGTSCTATWVDEDQGRTHLAELDGPVANTIDYKWTVTTDTCVVVFRGELVRVGVL